jgi:3-oxoacyl-[acyl-carrier protein] reductase
MDSGRVVLITGAAGGMGALLVERFLADGDTVIATDMSDEALARLDGNSRLFTHAADISDEASCAALGDFAREKARTHCRPDRRRDPHRAVTGLFSGVGPAR